MREKLIELLCEYVRADGCELQCNYTPCGRVRMAADHLIANGVTVNESDIIEKEIEHRRGMDKTWDICGKGW